MIQQKTTIAAQTEQPFLHLQHVRQRFQDIYRQNALGANEADLLEELALTIDMLCQVENAFSRHYTTLQSQQMSFEQEIRRYRELFTQAPIAYLITNPFGTIRQANHKATELLRANERLLIGRALEYFLPKGEHRTFRADVAELVTCGEVREWERMLQPWEGTPSLVQMTAMVVRGETGRSLSLRWLLAPIEE